MTEHPLSEAYFLAVEAIARAIGQTPLPAGLNTARVGDWTLTVNVSRDVLVTPDGADVRPYELLGQHEIYFAIAVLGPGGGLIAGYDEDRFIADLREFA